MATKQHKDLTGSELHDNKPFTLTGVVTTASNVTSGTITTSFDTASFTTAANTAIAANATIIALLAASHTHNTDTKLDEGGTNEISAASIKGHILSTTNPHSTTASQVGALPTAGGTMTGQINFSGTTHAGLKLNSLTTTQRDALTPSNGMIIYNTTDNQVQKYENGSWSAVGSGSGGGGTVSDWGDIGGTLSDQTDLQSALDAKQDSLAYTPANKAGDTLTGALLFSGTTHLGLKVLSLTTTQRDALTAANGYIIYNTTDNAFQKYENGAWSAIGSGGGGASALDDLTDVVVTTPASGDTLIYNGTEWTNVVSDDVFTFIDGVVFEFLP